MHDDGDRDFSFADPDETAAREVKTVASRLSKAAGRAAAAAMAENSARRCTNRRTGPQVRVIGAEPHR